MSGDRGARADAWERLGRRFDVRVLEPSPPAVGEPPFMADDPVSGGEVVPLLRVGARSWEEVCRSEGDGDLGEWAAERWLGPWQALGPLPAGFVETRQSLHAVAEHVVAPARHAATGKIGLRYTYRGFGTPFFGDDRQVRIEAGQLMLDRTDGAGTVALSSLREASIFVGVAPGANTGVYTPTTPGDLDAPLAVDPAAASSLGDWFGFCASVLEQFRDESNDAGSARVQIWPEHFDMAVDLGDEATGHRANYGGSPGDAEHPEPYLYIGPWSGQSGLFWTEPFGAALSYAKLLAAPDQRRAALAFLRRGRDLLSGAASPEG